MLNQMRALSQNWVGRSIFGVVLVLIIVGFLFVGTGGRFTTFNPTDLAQVGSTQITVTQYRGAYQNQLQQMQQKAKRGITNEEARRMGLDRQVLSRLLTDAVLDQEAKKLGLAVGDPEIAKTIMADDLFKGANGQFDNLRFKSLLASNGLNEASYVRDQREILMRQDVSDAVIGGMDVPKAISDAIHRYQAETRDITFFVLPASAAGEIAKPSDADLKKYYDDRTTTYVAPEYRKLVTLSVVPADLVKPDAISDADVQKRYDEMKALRFVVPEKRTIQQLPFADVKAAEAAKAKIDAGASFDKVAADEKKAPADINIGSVTKEELADKAVAEAAFSLPVNGTSAPVKSQFGTMLVHVSRIDPMRQQPLMEVSAQLRDELAIVRAKAEADRIRTKIEDERSAGKTLTEAAASVGLKPRTIDPIDAKGLDRSRKPVEGLVDGPALLKAAFGTDVGTETDMLKTDNGGSAWYEVAGIEAGHTLPFEAVKPAVEAGWRHDEIVRRLAAEAEGLVKDLDGGKSLNDVAAANGKAQVMRGRNIERAGAPGFPPGALNALFSVAVGKAGSAPDRDGRLVFKVDAARVPPLKPDDTAFTKLMAQVKTGYDDDVIAQYLARVQAEIGVKINQQALQTAIGGDSGS